MRIIPNFKTFMSDILETFMFKIYNDSKIPLWENVNLVIENTVCLIVD